MHHLNCPKLRRHCIQEKQGALNEKKETQWYQQALNLNTHEVSEDATGPDMTADSGGDLIDPRTQMACKSVRNSSIC